jgi:hypothetical protein
LTEWSAEFTQSLSPHPHAHDRRTVISLALYSRIIPSKNKQQHF